MSNIEAVEVWREVRVEFDHLMSLLDTLPPEVSLQEKEPVRVPDDKWKN